MTTSYSPAVQNYLTCQDQDNTYLARALTAEVEFDYKYSKELGVLVAEAYQALTEAEKCQVEDYYYS